MPVVAEIAMVPVGTCSPSMSQMLADSLQVLDTYGLIYEVTATGTNVEGDLDTILRAVKDMESVPFTAGAERVILMLRLDDRRDKPISLAYEEESIEEKLEYND